MAVAYQNKSETKVGTISNTCTISAPAGFSAGDLLIAVVIKDHSAVTTRPAGWTAIQAIASDTCYVDVSYRIAQSGDTSWNWTQSATAGEKWYGIILRYTGHDSSTPVHASCGGNGVDAAPTAPSVAYTDLESGSITLQIFGADDDDTPYTTPVALNERFNDVSSTGVGTCGGAGGDKSVSGTGSTGTAAFTMNASEGWAAATVVIEAVGAVGVAPTSVIYGPLIGPLGGPI